MTIQEMTQQAMEQNRELVENYIKGVVALQEQAEGLAEQAIAQAEMIPEEGRKALQGLIKMGREYREGVTAQAEKVRAEIEKMFPQK